MVQGYIFNYLNFFIMNAFEKHASVNEVSAKTALVSLAATVIGKYVITQSYMNSLLVGGSSPDEKSQACLQCRLNKLTSKMTKLEGQVGQIAKSYEMLFDEVIDMKYITQEAVKEFYPAFKGTPIEFNPEAVVAKVFTEGWDSPSETVPSSSNTSEPSSDFSWKPSASFSSRNGSTSTGSSPVSFPEGTPDEVRDITNVIKSALAKHGKNNVDIKVVDVSGKDGNLFGVNPNDYPDAKSFQKAIYAARDAAFAKAGSSEPCPSSMKGEEWFKENTIHAVEEAASHPVEEPTPSDSETGTIDLRKSSSKGSKLN
jgi:hypothetical protein